MITATADEILRHQFSFYGERHSLGPVVDWDANPGTGHWVHDLNRFLFLEPLVAAFRKTGEERYAGKCIELILSWIAQSERLGFSGTRFMFKSYLNIAIHLKAWVECLAAIDTLNSELLDDAAFKTICTSIGRQLEWLDRAIPRARNNWVFIGCMGTLTTVAFLPGLPGSREISARSWSRIEEALARQVLPDGVHDEMTPHYHLTVVSCVLKSLAYAEWTPTPPSSAIRSRVGAMLHYLEQTLTPDGLQVAFNESDPDYARAVRRTLDIPLASGLLKSDGRALESECFPWAGMIFMREGVARGREELYLAFDAGSFGVSHQHEDKLGFWLSAFGRSLVVDPGRHLYDASEASFRSFLASTAAHSTITIDGQGQNSLAARERPNAWRPLAPQPLVWRKHPDGTCEAGAFYNLGYGATQLAVIHFRIIFFFPDLQAWAVVDAIEGEGEHLMESRFQFAPGALNAGPCQVQTAFPDANLLVQGRRGDWARVSIHCGEQSPRAGWFSPGYNRIEPAPCALFSTGTRRLPWLGVLALIPFKGAGPVDPAITAECLLRAESRYLPILQELREKEAVS